jgi:hypothetical protein
MRLFGVVHVKGPIIGQPLQDAHKTVKYDKYRYKRRNRIERMFGRPKDWKVHPNTL